MEARINAVTLPGCQEPKISRGDIVKSMTGLLCMGKQDYEAVEAFREGHFFRYSLGIGQCPSSSTLRQRLDVVKGAFDRIIKEESARLIRKTTPAMGTVTMMKRLIFSAITAVLSVIVFLPMSSTFAQVSKVPITYT